MSRLKPAQWKELEETFKKFADTLGLQLRGRGRPKKTDQLDKFIEESMKNSDADQKKKEVVEEKVEEYDVWKKRILEEARAALQAVS